LIFNLAVAILIKLGFGLLLIYYAIMMIFLSDWMAVSDFNDNIATIGFFVVAGLCVVRKAYYLFRKSRWA